MIVLMRWSSGALWKGSFRGWIAFSLLYMCSITSEQDIANRGVYWPPENFGRMRPFPNVANLSSVATNPLFDERSKPEVLDEISNWMINRVVLLSMTLQVILACGGVIRHRCSNAILRFILWFAYMSADAVAIYALGNMAEQSLPGLSGISAPLLLLHLGGPDSITAYSTTDNELWKRHMLVMMFQISVAMYVIYVSGLKDRLLAAAILLAIVGATKYAERTLALGCASFSQIVSSATPMYYKYMNSDYARSCQYTVMEVTQWHKESVNIDDVWKAEAERATDNYMLCLSHALFKMYKRRYVNLHLFERRVPNTRRFFLGQQSEDMIIPPLPEDKLFPVIEMELKFLYDALFTKSSVTAYSKLGAVMRLVNIIILGIAGFIIFNELGKKHEFFHGALSTQRTVAYIAVGVGLVVEFFQLLGTIASDWTLVWLICSNIRLEHKEKPNSIERWAPKLLKSIIRYLSQIREKHGCRYWKREIRQYCIVDACSQISPFIWKWSGYFHVRDLIIRWYIETSPVEDDFKKFIVEQVKEKCSPEIGIENCRNKLTFWFSSLQGENSDTDHLLKFSNTDQEHLILYWHMATTICEMEYNMDDSNDEDAKRYFNTSKKLSRYGAYLLMSRPKLLPLHPDVAKMESMKLHSNLVSYYSEPKFTLQDFARDYSRDMCKEPYFGHGTYFHVGVELANRLFEIGDENKRRMWEVIARQWAEALIFWAKGARTTEHAEYLTAGGEFLTHLWVLIGNMGCGDQ